jgi:hypothetical protein
MPRSRQESSWLLFRLLGIWKHAVALAAVGRTEKMNLTSSGVSRCSTESFDGHNLFGRLGHGGEFYQQFFPFNEQQEHLAELQELCAVDSPAGDHVVSMRHIAPGYGASRS